MASPSQESATATITTASSPSQTIQSGSQQTSSSSTAPGGNSSSGGSDISVGALAGGVVGALIVGALIGLLLAWLLFRRRAKRQPRGDQPSDLKSAGAMRDTKHANGAAGGSARTVDAHLPSPAADDTIKGAFLTLFENVTMHVENFYTKQQVHLNAETAAGLATYDGSGLPAPLATLFGQARSGRPLITHVITRVMLDAIDPAGNAETSVLPAQLTGLPRALEHPDSKRPTQTASDEALSRWRVLTAYLLLPASLATTTATATTLPALPDYAAQRDAAVSRHVTALTQTFAPWINAGRESEARINLAEIFKAAAAKGLLLFAQPSGFGFEWDRAAREAGAVVVSPALVKVAGEHGAPLQTPQLMVAEVVTRA